MDSNLPSSYLLLKIPLRNTDVVETTTTYGKYMIPKDFKIVDASLSQQAPSLSQPPAIPSLFQQQEAPASENRASRRILEPEAKNRERAF